MLIHDEIIFSISELLAIIPALEYFISIYEENLLFNKKSNDLNTNN